MEQVDLGGRTGQGMEKDGESTEGSNGIEYVRDNASWFADSPHCWAEASLPLAC